ncbi:alpha/beta hydrolase fold family protein, partial [Vibrio parahaemolyticus EKP-021]
SPRIGRFI